MIARWFWTWLARRVSRPRVFARLVQYAEPNKLAVLRASSDRLRVARYLLWQCPRWLPFPSFEVHYYGSGDQPSPQMYTRGALAILMRGVYVEVKSPGAKELRLVQPGSVVGYPAHKGELWRITTVGPRGAWVLLALPRKK
jgi:hypothetical protein